MHKLLVALALVLMAPLAAAEDVETNPSHDYVALIAEGDVPGTTDTVEAPGSVHILEYVRFDHQGTSNVTVGSATDLSCTCGGFTRSGDVITVGPEVADGQYVVTVRHQITPGNALVVPLTLVDGHRASALVKVYLTDGFMATGPVDNKVSPGVYDGRDIHSFEGTGTSPLPAGFWMTVTPAVAPATTTTGSEDGFGYLELIIGLAVGVLVWFWLVQKGLVQARTRKQVVQKAAHQEVAAVESKDMLATRKRVLMAGLKELEMAKMQKEVEDGTYDTLKAELKKEAVTTMRALEGQS